MKKGDRVKLKFQKFDETAIILEDLGKAHTTYNPKPIAFKLSSTRTRLYYSFFGDEKSSY